MRSGLYKKLQYQLNIQYFGFQFKKCVICFSVRDVNISPGSPPRRYTYMYPTHVCVPFYVRYSDAINSSPPSTAYKRQWIGSPLFQ